MNRQALVCRNILEKPDITQREMAKNMDISLGTVNGLVKECLAEGYIAEEENGKEKYLILLEKGKELLKPYKVDGALIIAAGFGSRFVPLTFETPKGLLEVFGERMIERQIKQLHEVGIHDITIAVGYLKEKFEYLIDKYDVKLLYNPEYSCKNTLATVYRARKFLKGRNVYILSSDNWMRENMYHSYECGAWYSAAHEEGETKEWCLTFNKKGRISDVNVGGKDAWFMYGPVYLSREFSAKFLPVLEAYYQIPGTEQFYWEQPYVDMLKGEAKHRLGKEDKELLKQTEEACGVPASKWDEIEMDINRQPDDQVYEFENLEELRLFDTHYQNHSDNAAMELVAEVFHVPEFQITDIKCLKSGMTNKSFLFRTGDHHCICRIPGPGTELLINREQEKEVYDAVRPLGITEHVLYLNPKTGYKISEYYENTHNASADNWDDMKTCMDMVRKLHEAGLKVGHSFNIRERISFYEKLCLEHGGIPFEDYSQVREWVNQLLDALDKMDLPQCLCHIDANVDNFLMFEDGSAKLLDWEYAGMQDPHVDIAMFCIYSLYKKEQVDHLIDLYFEGNCDDRTRIKIYCYIAVCGLLWSNWCEYKRKLGVEFGEYSLRQYRYAKDYYKIVQQELGEEGKEICTK